MSTPAQEYSPDWQWILPGQHYLAFVKSPGFEALVIAGSVGPLRASSSPCRPLQVARIDMESPEEQKHVVRA